ncbi:hypothetical protein RI129_002071 [Pyrocoelia pectoralis]|uniref:Elongation of very long chain fatty acids protein n=1 Tax=Pyrocoelia pectoralis TaxID=417401 RepID=A0AAN7VNV9_9COLE
MFKVLKRLYGEDIRYLCFQYDYTLNEHKRTATWPLISSPLPLLALVAAYLYCVYIFLPKYMANRKPYSLKKYIAFYNVFQVIACCVVIYGISTSGWTMNYILRCQELDLSDDPIAIRMAHYIWLCFIVKVIELTETFVFILRKKSTQVSPLHVYHHSSTVLYAWLGVKYYPGGMAAFPILLNAFVHIIMYSYYFLSSLGPEMQTKLQVIKSKITVIQIVSFQK